MNETTATLDGLLTKLLDLGGSDLHLKVGSPPAFRVSGKLVIDDPPSLDAATTKDFAEDLMPDAARQALERSGEADFAFGRPALGRFRVHVYRQRGSLNVTIRSTRTVSYAFEALGLPRAVEEVCRYEHGLVIVAGRTASGKTTTLAAIIDHMNTNRRMNIITLEDPIEVIHPDKLSLVSQREIGLDTASFATGLRAVLRQDPDVVYVSELRDAEAAEEALRAARTGHFVLTAMLASDVLSTLDKLTEMFPAQEHQRIRRTIASSLRAIVCLRLVDRADGEGRIPAAEVLVNVGRVADAVAMKEGAPELTDLIAEGAYYGMQTFDQALLELQQKNLVSFRDAMANATDPTDFKLAVQALGLRTA